MATIQGQVNESRKAEQILFENNRKLNQKLALAEKTKGLNNQEVQHFLKLAEATDLTQDYDAKLDIIKESVINSKPQKTGLIKEETLFDPEDRIQKPTTGVEHAGWR